MQILSNSYLNYKMIYRKMTIAHGHEAPTRFELMISCLLDRRFNQLSHGATCDMCTEKQNTTKATVHSSLKKVTPNVGLEPTTLRLRVSCSTDWASRADVLWWSNLNYQLNLESRRWCSGIMQDSHSCDPGSIPGRRNFFGRYSFYTIYVHFFFEHLQYQCPRGLMDKASVS